MAVREERQTETERRLGGPRRVPWLGGPGTDRGEEEARRRALTCAHPLDLVLRYSNRRVKVACYVCGFEVVASEAASQTAEDRAMLARCALYQMWNEAGGGSG